MFFSNALFSGFLSKEVYLSVHPTVCLNESTIQSLMSSKKSMEVHFSESICS